MGTVWRAKHDDMSDAAARVWGGKGPPWRGQKYTGPPLGKVLHLYVDFFSPYGYLGSLGLDEIADHYGCTVEWHPMLLGKSYFGPTSVMKMPAVPSIPMKGPYTTRDIPRMAALMQVPLDYCGLMIPPTHTGRAFWYVHSTLGAEAATELARVMYRAHWSEGQDLGDPEEVARVGAQVLQGVSEADLLEGLKSDEAKRLQRDGVQQSIAAGVWGSPTVVVDGEMFWGVDRLWMVEEWLKRGGWIDGVELPSREMAEAIVEHTSVFEGVPPTSKL